MILAISDANRNDLVIFTILLIVLFAYLLKSGGKRLVIYTLCLVGIFGLKEVFLHLWGPTAEYAYVGFIVLAVIVLNIVKQSKNAAKTRTQVQIDIIKILLFILASIGVVILVLKIYQKAGVT